MSFSDVFALVGAVILVLAISAAAVILGGVLSVFGVIAVVYMIAKAILEEV